MEENENKNPEAAAEQPENTESMEAAQAPDAASGTKMDRQGIIPDGEGCQSVTVIIVEIHPDTPDRLDLAMRSVRQNLRGVDANCIKLTISPEIGLEQALLQLLDEATSDRIVLMTDEMVILNPITLADIALVKAKVISEDGESQIYDYRTGMPIMMYRSVLYAFLPWKNKELPYAQLEDIYFDRVMPDIRPIQVVKCGETWTWRNEPWMIPVTSANPDVNIIRSLAISKKFIHLGPDSWSREIAEFLEKRFSE